MDGNTGISHGRVVAALDGVSMRRHTGGQVILDSVDWTVRAGE
ncbi:ABC transporter ATP-binding protein, partial [Streptomyces sp. SID7982]|nr:ABC transporter ATP-binding protein [Streptomyces sp. SID7982]